MKRKNIYKCRRLRKNQTDTEKKLWAILRNRQLSGIKFRRQFSVDRYILDFYCPEYKIGIEADGGQHYEDEGKRRDELRRGELNKLGVEIVRFNDREILTNINWSVRNNSEYHRKEEKKSPSPQSSPRWGEEVRNELRIL